MDPSLYLIETFAPHVGEAFVAAAADGQKVPLKLTGVQPGPVSPGVSQFSILFLGPRANFLPQRMYKLEHAALGGMDIFLVPVGEEPDGFIYQAVFNRMLPRQPKR